MGTCYVCGKPMVLVITKEFANNPQICGTCAGPPPEGVVADVRPAPRDDFGTMPASDVVPPRVVPEGHPMSDGPS